VCSSDLFAFHQVARQGAQVDGNEGLGLAGGQVVDGRRRDEGDPALALAGDADASNDYIAVTLLVASRQRLSIKGVENAEQLRDALALLGAVPAADLLALEVIWQPDAAGDVLNADELITAYPQLKHL
jgi:uncharacterized membrane protein